MFICLSCHMKRELSWAEWAADELLEDVPHRQVVFTIAKRLRPYFRYERALLGELAACAWRALWLWVLAYLDEDSAVPGAIGFIQTAGELLNLNQHSECRALSSPLSYVAADRTRAIRAEVDKRAREMGAHNSQVICDTDVGPLKRSWRRHTLWCMSFLSANRPAP